MTKNAICITLEGWELGWSKSAQTLKYWEIEYMILTYTF